MPRAFSEKEKEAVRESLLGAGEKLLGRLGITKTSVEDVTREAGVAKGTFYAFWPTKEAFVFACIERTELRIQDEFLAPVLAHPGGPARAIGSLIPRILGLFEDYPLLRDLLDPEVFARLYRRIPAEMQEAHREKDRMEISDMLGAWKGAGFDPGIPPGVFDGLMKAFMMVSLHKDVIGEDIYPEVVETLGRIVSAGVQALSDERKSKEKER